MRISFRNRNVGYPLMTPEPRDYLGGRFDIEPPDARRTARGVSLNIAYQLESEYLHQLVQQGKAAFQTLIVGDNSFLREATPKTQAAMQQHTLDRDQWTGTVEMMPYLTATERITRFSCDEHDPEFAIVESSGFTIESAMILAVGNVHEVDISKTSNVSSVVDAQADPGLQRGEFRLDMAHPDIMVYLAPDDFTALQRIENDPRESRRQSLWPSIYLTVITEGIRKLPYYGDYSWVQAFERALRKSGFDPEDHELMRDDALTCAQRIIFDEKQRYPLGMMLDAFADEDSDPQDYD